MKLAKRPSVAFALAAALAAGAGTLAQPVAAQSAAAPANSIDLSVGTGRLVQLNAPMTDLFVANEGIADVQVRSPTQLYVFAKGPGETTLYATNKAGRTVYSATIRAGVNIGSIGEMLSVTMPEARIAATPMNGLVLLTGTVAAPDDAAEAERLVQAFVGQNTQVISRLKTATPLQVMLKVRIAEVSRSLMKDIGFNLATVDPTSGFKFGVGQGRSFYPQFTPGGPLGVGTEGPAGSTVVTPATSGTSLFGAGSLFGLDVLAALDLNQDDGLVTTLAEPTLVALSGETASFLAGGEFPIATSSGLNGTEIEFKEYGVSLAFTPIVLEGGRISMRVRPEVSELTSEGAVTLNNVQIPALITRRAETTVELGSGQSFMIGGLMRNSSNNSVNKAPFLGDLPILGALFKSSSFRRNETELVIVVTPYLVKPVSDSQIALPTDGYRSPPDAARILVDQTHAGRSGEQRPGPTEAPPRTVGPSVGPVSSAAPVPAAVAPASRPTEVATSSGASPGFSF